MKIAMIFFEDNKKTMTNSVIKANLSAKLLKGLVKNQKNAKDTYTET